VYPKEGDWRRGPDVRERPVACQAGDEAPNCEAKDDGGGFHEWAAELLDYDDGDKDGEAETDELWVAPVF
jgi:hypothetical protein